MLISPKYKLIFFKTLKSAGSSIEASLLKHCTSDALCTGGMKVSLSESFKLKEEKRWDGIADSLVEYKQQNNVYYEGNYEINRFHSHTWPDLFFGRIKNKAVYDDYRRVAVFRNPWDQVVSYYWWCVHNTPERLIIRKDDSRSKVRKKFSEWTNSTLEWTDFTRYYSTLKSDPVENLSFVNEKFIHQSITDYLMYENVGDEYTMLCETLGIDKSVSELQKLKSSRRSVKMHYSEYYDVSTKLKVEKAFQKTVEKFDYKFQK